MCILHISGEKQNRLNIFIVNFRPPFFLHLRKKKSEKICILLLKIIKSVENYKICLKVRVNPKIFVNIHYKYNNLIILFTKPSARAGYDTMSILSRV